MAIDIQTLFNETLTQGLQKHADTAKTMDATFQINVTGEGGGNWFIDVTSSGPSVEQTSKEATCTVEISAEDFEALYSNPLQQGMALFMAGKIKISGDMSKIMSLQKLFSFEP